MIPSSARLSEHATRSVAGGGIKALQCAHVFSRARKSVRWDLDNAVTLCYRHHLFWAHSEPIEFSHWIQARLGARKFYALQKRANTIKKHTPLELIDIEEDLKKKLKAYETSKG